MLSSLQGNVEICKQKEAQDVHAATNLLDGIQHKVENAMYASFSENNTEPLKEIFNQLNSIEPKNNIVTYWMAYTNYYEAIFLLKTKDKSASEAKLNEGINLLQKQQKKNSEDYTLLALLQSFSIQFKSGMAAGMMASNVVDNAKKAISLDSLNLRAWYVLASNDFYTPKSFGGGKKAEGYLKKAVSIPEKPQKNSYLPTWGREYAYDMLIRLYIKKNDLEKARETLKSATEAFPDSYMIKQYEDKLKVN